MKVYLAGPMSGYMDEQDYRRKIKKILNKYKVEYVCPLEMDFRDLGEEESLRLANIELTGKFDDTDQKLITDVMMRDLAVIDDCNVVIAYMPFISAGTMSEVFYASEIKNKVIVLFMDRPRSWLIGMGDFFVKNYAELERVIKKMLGIENGDTE